MPEQPRRSRKPRRRGALSAIVALLTLRALRGARRRRGQREGASGGVADAQQAPLEPRRPSRVALERVVAMLLVAAGLLAFAFTAAYVAAGTNPQLLGGALGGALALLAAACIIAGKLLVPQEKSVEHRPALFDERASEQVLEIAESGARAISRRELMLGSAGLAGAGLLTAAVTPVASLGPDLDAVHATPWRSGVRLVDERGNPYAARDIRVGAFYTALPEHANPELLGASLVVVRLAPAMIHLPAARRSWAPEGILAYSKICTHAGCAISLYRYPTYAATSAEPALTCPCHYSTFLPGEGGRVSFGPAGRALPQLPLMIDGEGNLRAAGGFGEDVGPSWWSVRRGQS